MIIDFKYRYKSGIYEIRNLVNNNFYIGSSRNIYNRFHTHLSRLKNNKHSNEHLQNSFNKHGIDNFSFSVLLYCNIESLIFNEDLYIKKLQPIYNKNLTITEPFIRKFTEEERKLISNKMKTYYINGGKKTFKPILVYDLLGNFVKECESITLFAKEQKVNVSRLVKSLKSKTRKFREFQIKYKSSNSLISAYKNPRIKEKPKKIYLSKIERRKVLQKSFWASTNKHYKLKENDILKIKQMYKEDIKQKEIALLFNIDPSHVSRIINNVIRKGGKKS